MTNIFQESLLVILLLSGVPLTACAITGLVVSFLQAATQIQEQTITYLVKLLTIVVIIAICHQWAIGLVTEYTTQILEGIGAIGS